MTSESAANFGRRGFLKGVAAATSLVPRIAPAITTGGVVAASVATSKAQQPLDPASNQQSSKLPAPELGYESLSPDEAAFVEAMVNVMCPADSLTPNGVDCGLAVFIDRQLAGGFGKGERLYMHGPWKKGKPQHGYQLPLTPEQFFKAGVAVVNDVCRNKFGKEFADLSPSDADNLLHDLAANKVEDPRLPLDSWFNELAYPLFVEACFADPIYGGNNGKVFWKMIGYPGFRGKPYPQAKEPKGIGDFS